MKFTHIAFSLVIAVSVLGGCAGSVEEPPAVAAAPTKAAIPMKAQGVAKIVGDAFADVPLRPEQRGAIEELFAEMDRRHLAAEAGMTELGLTLADLALQGHIDAERFDPLVVRIGEDIVKMRDVERDAIVKVHALLDHDQRSAIATAIDVRLNKGGGALDPKAKLPPPLFAELNLTAEQRQQLRAVFASAHPAHDDASAAPARPYTRQTMLAALRADALDVDQIAPRHESMQLAMFDPSFVRPLADSVLAILTPEQRKTASEWFRANASQLEFAFRG